jgi:Cysteine-rich secretory protein family
MKRVRKTLRKYFVPHDENDHKPQILRPRSVAFVLVIALAIEGAFWFGSTQLVTNSRLYGIILANALVDETNQSRVANDVPPLTENPLLDEAAKEKANDMATNNYFAHTSPSGLSPWYWFEQVGYGFTYAGENLAVNFTDSQDVTNAWMNSTEHRENILNPNFTQIGMATATGTYEGHPAVYVVEEFGTPVPPAPPAEAPLALINAAAAEGEPAASNSAAPTPKPAPAKTAATKTPPKTTPAKTPPVTTASSDFVTTTSNPSFVSIEGVETSTVATASSSATSTASTTALALAGAGVGTVGPSAGGSGVGTIVPAESNPIQRAASDPRQIVDYIYLAIITLFALALGINVFVRVRIQHAQVIFGGMLVILVVGLLIVLNQHALAAAAIL